MMTKRLSGAWAWLMIALLNLPILVVVAASFSSSRYLAFPPPGFTLDWYVNYLTTPRWVTATINSFKVAALTVILATPLGVLASFGLARGRFRGRKTLAALAAAPLIVPTIIAAVGMYMLFARLGLVGGFWAVVLAHTALTIPVVIVSVNAVLVDFDMNLELAAQGLGATRWRAFWHVTRPIIQPALLTGALFAFLMSFDELTVALFLSGVESQTLPVRMWASLREEIDPTIAAISTLLILLSVIALLGAELARRRPGRSSASSA